MHINIKNNFIKFGKLTKVLFNLPSFTNKKNLFIDQ